MRWHSGASRGRTLDDHLRIQERTDRVPVSRQELRLRLSPIATRNRYTVLVSPPSSTSCPPLEYRRVLDGEHRSPPGVLAVSREQILLRAQQGSETRDREWYRLALQV